MFCKQCGNQLNDGAAFCPACGAQITRRTQNDNTGNQIEKNNKQRKENEQPGKSDPRKSHKKVVLGIAAIVALAGIAVTAVLILNNQKSGLSDRPSTYQDTSDSYTTGSVTDTATSGYDSGSDNTTANTVQEEPAYADTSSNSVATEKKSRTMMVYICGSNLESEGAYATSDIYEILNANRGEQMNIVIQSGGSTKWQNDWMTDGTVQRFVVEGNSLTKLADLGRESMVKTESLSDFIKSSAEAYPADSYILILWDHGGGIPIMYGMDELDAGDSLTALEIREAIMDAGVHFETIAFDACLMGTLETVLALKDCTDYVVGAESTVVGNGMYYTDFVELLSSNEKVDAQDYCEKMVQDYIKTAHESGQAGSMSVIRTKNIQAVYDAYVDFMKQALSDYNQGAFPEYVRALEECGRYENPDCVDLSMLAQFFENTQSVKLSNAVNNAVVFTLSDYWQGRGITAYSPYQKPEYYDQGRSLFTGLGYDNTILAFYDQFVSDLASIQGGDTLAQIQGCSWYIGESVTTTQANTAETTGDKYSLEIIDIGGNWGIHLPENFKNVWQYLWMGPKEQNGKTVYRYIGRLCAPGQMDQNRNMVFKSQRVWPMYKDGNGGMKMLDYDLLYYKNDGSGWMFRGRTPCRVNGRSAYLYLVYNKDHNPEAFVEGYVFSDFEGQGYPEDDTMYPLWEGDVITPLQRIVDMETGETNYNAALDFQYWNGAFSNGDFTIDDRFVFWWEVEDAYGNVYETDACNAGAFAN